MKNNEDITIEVKPHYEEYNENPDALIDAFVRIIMADLQAETENHTFDKLTYCNDNDQVKEIKRSR